MSMPTKLDQVNFDNFCRVLLANGPQPVMSADFDGSRSSPIDCGILVVADRDTRLSASRQSAASSGGNCSSRQECIVQFEGMDPAKGCIAGTALLVEGVSLSRPSVTSRYGRTASIP